MKKKKEKKVKSNYFEIKFSISNLVKSNSIDCQETKKEEMKIIQKSNQNILKFNELDLNEEIDIINIR